VSKVEIRYDDSGKPFYCIPSEHRFESGGLFGVIIGVSRCKRCGKVSSVEDFGAGVLDAQAPRKEG
jgi:hypothetical protein